jgi:hypothetical protein
VATLTSGCGVGIEVLIGLRFGVATVLLIDDGE